MNPYLKRSNDTNSVEEIKEFLILSYLGQY